MLQTRHAHILTRFPAKPRFLDGYRNRCSHEANTETVRITIGKKKKWSTRPGVSLPVRHVPCCSEVISMSSYAVFEVAEALISERVGLKAGPVVPLVA